MAKIGIIGGSGLGKINNLEVVSEENADTPYGKPSCSVVSGIINNQAIVFLPRHGSGHSIAPHNINYRANVWALKEAGVTHLIAINAVGGITKNMSPLTLVFPDQIIDYTYSREHTFFDANAEKVTHVDFTHPYSSTLRTGLYDAANAADIKHESKAVYGVTQGPRLETSAEIQRMEKDGCDIVGMTGMPEAVLARELGLEYASCSVVVNWAAGKGDGQALSMKDIEKCVEQGMGTVRDLLEKALPELI
jgi:5'-methylthioinosine phosphorylase